MFFLEQSLFVPGHLFHGWLIGCATMILANVLMYLPPFSHSVRLMISISLTRPRNKLGAPLSDSLRTQSQLGTLRPLLILDPIAAEYRSQGEVRVDNVGRISQVSVRDRRFGSGHPDCAQIYLGRQDDLTFIRGRWKQDLDVTSQLGAGGRVISEGGTLLPCNGLVEEDIAPGPTLSRT